MNIRCFTHYATAPLYVMVLVTTMLTAYWTL